MVILSFFVGLWNLLFILGQVGENYFGINFNFDGFFGLATLSCLALLIIGLQLSGVLKLERANREEERSSEKINRILAYVIILTFSGFILWFLWIKVFSTF